MKRGQVVALAGGVGAARFLDGLTRVIEPERVYIIGNTADDAEIQGLHISPDLDTVTYTLAGLANPLHGWVFAATAFGAWRRWGGWARIPGFSWAIWTWPRTCTAPSACVTARRFPT